MRRVLSLACTGGIGSGKSYVASVFEKLGYPVYYSDSRVKELYDTDPLLLQDMVDLLGKEILKEGKLNRGVVASKIFADKGLLESVEKIVHPALLRDFEKWKQYQQENLSEDYKFVLFESAIILEKPIFKSLPDKILNVVAPLQLRIERVMKRDGVSREQVLERLSKQWSDEQRAIYADFTIFANSQRAVLPQIIEVIEKMNLLS